MRILQASISGRDFNGFVWQNVFCVTTTDDTALVPAVLTALNNKIDAAILPDMLAAMSDQCTVLDIASRIISAPSSYTIHKSENVAGDRVDPQDSGAIAGRIAWFPLTGAYVGHQYITGVCEDDFNNDFIAPAYEALLTTLLNTMRSLDGSDATWGWQLAIYNKKLATAVPVAAGEVMVKAGILSKRIRA